MQSVVLYLGAGFEAGEPGVAIATPEHRLLLEARLESGGWDPHTLGVDGLLSVVDASETLASFMLGGTPSKAFFERTVGGLIDRVARRHPGRRLRCFGEMVDLLWADGNLEGALAVESLWDELAVAREFSLLCGYRVDVFDRASQTAALPRICRAHSHVRAADDPERLQQALDHALEETLGNDSGKIYAMIGAEIRGARVPTAQLALMWVSRHMPGSAERILASAREHYLAEAS
jgi:hypothetical protein